MISHNERSPTAPVSHQHDLTKAQRTRSTSDETGIASTKPSCILPLIAVWLQVRVLPGPPKNQWL